MLDNTLQLARDAVDNILKNGKLCPNDTDGDGDCGKPLCPVCGEFKSNKMPKNYTLKPAKYLESKGLNSKNKCPKCSSELSLLYGSTGKYFRCNNCTYQFPPRKF